MITTQEFSCTRMFFENFLMRHCFFWGGTFDDPNKWKIFLRGTLDPLSVITQMELEMGDKDMVG